VRCVAYIPAKIWPRGFASFVITLYFFYIYKSFYIFMVTNIDFITESISNLLGNLLFTFKILKN